MSEQDEHSHSTNFSRLRDYKGKVLIDDLDLDVTVDDLLTATSNTVGGNRS